MQYVDGDHVRTLTAQLTDDELAMDTPPYIRSGEVLHYNPRKHKYVSAVTESRRKMIGEDTVQQEEELLSAPAGPDRFLELNVDEPFVPGFYVVNPDASNPFQAGSFEDNRRYRERVQRERQTALQQGSANTHVRKNAYYEGQACLRTIAPSGSTYVLRFPFRPELKVQISTEDAQNVAVLDAIRRSIAFKAKCNDDQVQYELRWHRMARVYEPDPKNPLQAKKSPVLHVTVPNVDAYRAATRALFNRDEPDKWVSLNIFVKTGTTRRKRPVSLLLHEAKVGVEQQIYERFCTGPKGWIKVTGGFRYVPHNERWSKSAVHEVYLGPAAVVGKSDRVALAPHFVVSYDGEMHSARGNGYFCDSSYPGDAVTHIGLVGAWYFAVPPRLAEMGVEPGKPYQRVMLTLQRSSPLHAGVSIEHAHEGDMLSDFRNFMVVRWGADVVVGWNIFGFDDKYLYHRSMMYDCTLFSYRHWITFYPTLEPEKKRIKGRSESYMLFPNRNCTDGLAWDLQNVNRFDGASLDSVSREVLGVDTGKYRVKARHMNLVYAQRRLYPDDGRYKRQSVEHRGCVGMTPEEEDPLDLMEDRDRCRIPQDDAGVYSNKAVPLATAADVASISLYCFQDCDLVLHILSKTGYIGQIAQQCNKTYMSYSRLSTSGQQMKLVNCLSRFAHEDGMIMNGIGSSMFASKIPYTGGCVINPRAGLYGSKKGQHNVLLGTLDFASLYPSIINQFNICPSVWVHPDNVQKLRDAGMPIQGHVITRRPDGRRFGELAYFIMHIPERTEVNAVQAEKIAGLPEKDRTMYDDTKRPIYVRRIETETVRTANADGELLEKQVHWQCNDLCPGIKSRGVQGFIPKVLQFLLSTRNAAKKDLKAAKKTGDTAATIMWDCVQKAIKVVMNSVYGFMGVGYNDKGQFTGMWPFIHASKAICLHGERYLRWTVDIVEGTLGEYCDVIYGDTDSVMVRHIGDMVEGAKRLQNVEYLLTATFGNHMRMELEDLYVQFLSLASKKYSGAKLYEPSVAAVNAYLAGQEFVGEGKTRKPVVTLKVKGLKPVRRDICTMSRRVLKDVIQCLVVPGRGGVVAALHTLEDHLENLVLDKFPLSDYCTGGNVKAEADYKDGAESGRSRAFPTLALATLVWARQKRVPGSEMQPGDRGRIIMVQQRYADKGRLIPPPGRPDTDRFQRVMKERPPSIKPLKRLVKKEVTGACVAREPTELPLRHEDVDRGWYIYHQICNPLLNYMAELSDVVQDILANAYVHIGKFDNLRRTGSVQPVVMQKTVGFVATEDMLASEGEQKEVCTTFHRGPVYSTAAFQFKRRFPRILKDWHRKYGAAKQHHAQHHAQRKTQQTHQKKRKRETSSSTTTDERKNVDNNKESEEEMRPTMGIVPRRPFMVRRDGGWFDARWEKPDGGKILRKRFDAFMGMYVHPVSRIPITEEDMETTGLSPITFASTHVETEEDRTFYEAQDAKQSAKRKRQKNAPSILNMLQNMSKKQKNK